MTEWVNDLAAMWWKCWQAFGRGAADAASPLHSPVLATTGLGGGAEARILVLRRTSQSERTLTLTTDAASTKVAELAANPMATLLFWDPEAKLQSRARVEVRTDRDTDALWQSLSDEARRNYGGKPPTGAPIPSADAYDKTPDPARLVRLICHVQSLDIVYLGQEHRRALYWAEDDFAGQWLAP